MALHGWWPPQLRTLSAATEGHRFCPRGFSRPIIFWKITLKMAIFSSSRSRTLFIVLENPRGQGPVLQDNWIYPNGGRYLPVVITKRIGHHFSGSFCWGGQSRGTGGSCSHAGPAHGYKLIFPFLFVLNIKQYFMTVSIFSWK